MIITLSRKQQGSVKKSVSWLEVMDDVVICFKGPSHLHSEVLKHSQDFPVDEILTLLPFGNGDNTRNTVDGQGKYI